MATLSFGHIALSAGSAPDAGRPPRPQLGTPLRLCILGDFGGRANRGTLEPEALATRRLIEVDRDNFESVMALVKPRLSIAVGRETPQHFDLALDDLDAFHPDALVDRLPLFADLRALRRRLRNSATFDAAAAEMAGWAASGQGPARGAEGPEGGKPASGYTTDDLFQAIDETEERAVKPPSTGEAMAAQLIRDVVGPFVEPKPDPRQAELVAAVDAATAEQMRAVLHHPDLQALEALWRGVDLLVRRLETGTDLKMFLVDIAKEELAADVGAVENLRDSGLYRLLVESSVETPGGSPWGLWLGAFTADGTAADADLLGRLARLAARAGAPLLAGAAPALIDCPDFATHPDPADWRSPPPPEAEDAWLALRALPEAAWLGLALPRILMRPPYGRMGGSVEAFDFEEIPGAGRHADFLWGNPAFLAALLIGEAFAREGWDLRPGQPSEVDGLPLHYYDEDGDRAIKPCAEVLLTERASDRFAERGLIPVWWVRDTDRVRLVPLRALSRAKPALQGRWAG
ncbi:MAG: hypothetical protein GVY13_06610 [Alphaproteobacteria bacterium]|jgi:type VI secretion system protein ImpC|nr:hypothetical protein [Alphaproteobacteria bacterium]